MEEDRRCGVVRRAAAAALKAGIFVLLFLWLGLWCFRPAKRWRQFYTRVSDGLGSSRAYGSSPANWMLFAAPVFLIVVLGAVYLEIRASRDAAKKSECKTGGMRARVSLWSYPVMVRGPLGLVTAADQVFLVLFAGFIVYLLCMYFDHQSMPPNPHEARWQRKMSKAGHKTGQAGLITMAFIFFPVTRGSVLLRLVNISFQHATKYHKWMASIMMAILLAHGATYFILWYSMGMFWQQFWRWNRNGFNNLAGIIATVAGLFICVTSLPRLRARFFELFYITHQLYIVFVFFVAIHVGLELFSVVMAGFFLFALDRLLRFMQSRKPVAVIISRNLPGDTLELVFAKHPGLQYKPASFIFLCVPSVSGLQWHPFTISSSSQVQQDRMSILVKCCGQWTKGLRSVIQNASPNSSEQAKLCPFYLEGPYGEESSTFLQYDALIFVAGGSGISPFLSMLTELIYLRRRSKSPTDVMLIWAVRSSRELQILDAVLPLSIAQQATFQVQAHVTREQAADMEATTSDIECSVHKDRAAASALEPETGRDSNRGILIMLAASLVGYLFIWGRIFKYYLDPRINHNRHMYPSWAEVLFSLLSMLAGIAGFGGVASMLCNRWLGPKLCSSTDSDPQIPDATGMEAVKYVQGDSKLLASANVQYGCRPNFQEIFRASAVRNTGKRVGVFTCGPASLQADVAEQCKTHTSSAVAFPFHSISFGL